jgi:hypothetical protein
MNKYSFFNEQAQPDVKTGFRSGPRGTHSSRTIMLDELSMMTSEKGLPDDVSSAVLEQNILGKATSSGRVITLQRIKELYCFDSTVLIFRVFSRLCQRDPAALPQLALLMAIARDPLLRASARPILGLASGSQLMRDSLRNAIASVVGTRMNEATLDKVARNTASSWTKTGHLIGRTIKRRARVRPNPTAFAFALWLAQKAGFSGNDLLTNGWSAAIDVDPLSARGLTDRAHAAGLIVFRTIGESFALDVSPLERQS